MGEAATQDVSMAMAMEVLQKDGKTGNDIEVGSDRSDN